MWFCRYHTILWNQSFRYQTQHRLLKSIENINKIYLYVAIPSKVWLKMTLFLTCINQNKSSTRGQDLIIVNDGDFLIFNSSHASLHPSPDSRINLIITNEPQHITLYKIIQWTRWKTVKYKSPVAASSVWLEMNKKGCWQQICSKYSHAYHP